MAAASNEPRIRRFCNHSRTAIDIAMEHGWSPGARYTNLRDVSHLETAGNLFLDIDWKDYCFEKHLEATRELSPHLTIAQDIVDSSNLTLVMQQADQLSKYSDLVAIVPKCIRLDGRLEELIPSHFLLGYSVPTRYGGTELSIDNFTKHRVHLLGGRPDTQRELAKNMNVYSLDCNRFTLDARFGDYFDGETFRPHPRGGYETCLENSVININALWSDY